MKPKVLLIACQKGGVGKTTTATALAVVAQEDGKNVVIFDIDPQGTASEWHDDRKSFHETDDPAVISVHSSRLKSMIDAATGEGVDLIIIDSPPIHRDITKDAANVADFALLITQPSAFDEKSTMKTIEIVEQANCPYAIVFNLVDPQGFEAKDAFEAAQNSKVQEVCPVIMKRRVAYRRAQAVGLTATEFERSPRKYTGGKMKSSDGEASKEIEALYRYTGIRLYQKQQKGVLANVTARAS